MQIRYLMIFIEKIMPEVDLVWDLNRKRYM